MRYLRRNQSVNDVMQRFRNVSTFPLDSNNLIYRCMHYSLMAHFRTNFFAYSINIIQQNIWLKGNFPFDYVDIKAKSLFFESFNRLQHPYERKMRIFLSQPVVLACRHFSSSSYFSHIITIRIIDTYIDRNVVYFFLHLMDRYLPHLTLLSWTKNHLLIFSNY